MRCLAVFAVYCCRVDFRDSELRSSSFSEELRLLSGKLGEARFAVARCNANIDERYGCLLANPAGVEPIPLPGKLFLNRLVLFCQIT